MTVTPIREFLSSEEWDTPFFKRLAHNDTARASGHQAGIVVPIELRKFFPILDEKRTSARSPTIDRNLRAEMYLSSKQIGHAIVRYQFQTWGGTRSPESRITGSLLPITRRATAGDLLLFQRSADTLDHFRLILIRKTARDFSAVDAVTDGRRWGPLFAEDRPVTQVELEQASKELETLADEPFELVKRTVVRTETRQSRIARSSVFPAYVRREYKWRCCISGIYIATPTSVYEVEAAHVVPVSEGGTDDIRNGLSMTKTLHWAFDQGLFGIGADRKIYLPRRVKSMRDNTFLKEFEGKIITEAATTKLRVHQDALRWHAQNRVNRWE